MMKEMISKDEKKVVIGRLTEAYVSIPKKINLINSQIDEIKERYTIGDTLKISGNVKTLAGSNVTDAKVVWNVNRSVYLTEYYPNQENQCG